jgi:hypothetical protein
MSNATRYSPISLPGIEGDDIVFRCQRSGEPPITVSVLPPSLAVAIARQLLSAAKTLEPGVAVGAKPGLFDD